MIKAHSSGRVVSTGVSDVLIASVYSEKTRLKKLMMMKMIIIIIIMNKSQETTVFSGRRKVETLYGSLYWWVELGVPSLHREWYVPSDIF